MKARLIGLRVLLCIQFCFSVCSHAIGDTTFRILSTSSVNGHEIGICFSAAVDPVSAADPRNYSLADTNIIVTNAIVRADHSTVVLRLSQRIIGYSFVLIVGDVWSAANLSLANHVVAGGVMGRDGQGFNSTAIGSPPNSGTVFGCTNSIFSNNFDVQAIGSGIGGTNDSFFYVYHEAYPRFAVEVRLSALIPGIHQAGLLARKSLHPGSPFVALLASSEGGAAPLKLATLFRDSNGVTASPWPAAESTTFSSFPIWLRLESNGQSFSASGSADRLNWTTLGTIQIEQFTGSEKLFMGAATVNDPNVLDQNETEYRSYRIEPHGDIFPMPPNIAREGDRLTLSWPSMLVLEWSDFQTHPPQWTLLTNNIQFGAFQNQATLRLPGLYPKQFFRLREP